MFTVSGGKDNLKIEAEGASIRQDKTPIGERRAGLICASWRSSTYRQSIDIAPQPAPLIAAPMDDLAVAPQSAASEQAPPRPEALMATVAPW